MMIFPKLLISVCLVIVAAPLQAQLVTGKCPISISACRYIIRENGCFEILFIDDRCGLPAFGLANIASLDSDEAIKLLDLKSSVVDEIRSLSKEFKIRSENATSETDLFTLEEDLRTKVVSKLTDAQRTKWNWVNRRNVFFSTGISQFLALPVVAKELDIRPEQLVELRKQDKDHAIWLRQEMNDLYFSALEEYLEPIDEESRKRFFELLGQPNSEVFSWPVSTLYWFCSKKRNLRYEKKAVFVETQWKLNLASELDCFSASSVETGLHFIIRYFLFYELFFQSGRRGVVWDAVLELTKARPPEERDPYFQLNDEGKLPLLEFVDQLSKTLRASQEDRQFDRYVLTSNLRNVGFLETIENERQLDEFSSEDLKDIVKQEPLVAKKLKTSSNDILQRFIETELDSLSATQRHQLCEMLIPRKEDEQTMVPLELVYLGIVMGQYDRKEYITGTFYAVGSRIPDVDFLELGDTYRDERRSRLK